MECAEGRWFEFGLKCLVPKVEVDLYLGVIDAERMRRFFSVRYEDPLLGAVAGLELVRVKV
jgi:hypothetical protein